MDTSITVGFDFSKGFSTDFPKAAQRLEQLFKNKINGRVLSEPLGRISASASELSKSLDAANARVIAFSASVGIIYSVQKAFSSLVKSTIDVEKRLADINVILNENSVGLGKFADRLFDIAKKTGQSFDSVSEAALEFSRQGLSVQETLKRTNDALVLQRLTGLSAKDAVESLTASVNSFNKSLITTADVVNKFASVDAAFAVSSSDLAEGLKRVGSTAQDAGVGINELIGLITAAQQITSRGGAVIGNALKTVFARIGNPESIKDLQDLGVAIDNTQDGIQKLTALSNALKTADADTAALIKKTAGGVYQLNQISAILSDLGNQYSIYTRATQQAANATDEATVRNLELNKTLSASLNALQQNLTQTFSKIGNSTIKNPLGDLVGATNNALENINADGVGSKIGQAFLSGISEFITGPGAVYFTVIGANLLNNFRKFTLDSIKELRTFSLGQQERAANEQAIIQLLAREPALQAAIASGELSIAEAQGVVLTQLQSELLLREKIAAAAKAISPSLKQVNVEVDKNSGVFNRRRPSFADGFLPTSSEVAAEMAQAKAGGYTPGQVRTTNIKGLGSVVYNTAERIVNFPGLSQPAILPPQNSKAGNAYKQNFQSRLGFNPYGASGVIPNIYADGLTPSNYVKGNFDSGIRADQKLIRETVRNLLKEFESGAISARKVSDKIEKIAGQFALTEDAVLKVKSAFSKFKKDVEIDKAFTNTLNTGSAASPVMSGIANKRALYSALRTPPSFGGGRTSKFDLFENLTPEQLQYKQLQGIQFVEPRAIEEQRGQQRAKLAAEFQAREEQKARDKIARETRLSKTTDSAFNFGNIFSFNKIAKDLQGQGLQSEEINALKNRVRERNQQRAFIASIAAPFVAEGLAAAIGTETRGARVGSSIASGLGNVVGLGATGFSIGGPVGGGIGAGIGLATSIPNIFDAITSKIPELEKAFKDLSDEASKSRASLANFRDSTEKLFRINSGEIAYKPSDKQRLIDQQSAALQGITNPVLRNRINTALGKGDLEGAIGAFSDADLIKGQNANVAGLSENIAKRAKNYRSPIRDFLNRANSLINVRPIENNLNPLSPSSVSSITTDTQDIFKQIGSLTNERGESILRKIQTNPVALSGIRNAGSTKELTQILNQVGGANNTPGLGNVFSSFGDDIRVTTQALNEFKKFFTEDAISKSNEEIIKAANGTRVIQKSLFDLSAELQKSSDLVDKLGNALSSSLIDKTFNLQNQLVSGSINRQGITARNNLGAGEFQKISSGTALDIAALKDTTATGRLNLRNRVSEDIFEGLRNLKTDSLVQIRQSAENNAGKGDVQGGAKELSNRFGAIFNSIGFNENTKISDFDPSQIGGYIERINKVIGDIGGPLGQQIKSASEQVGDPKIVGDFVARLRTFLKQLQNLQYNFDKGEKTLSAEQTSGVLRLTQQGLQDRATNFAKNSLEFNTTGLRNAGELSLTQNRANFEISESLRNLSNDIKNFGQVGLPRIQADFFNSSARIGNTFGFDVNQNVSRGLNNLRSSQSYTTRGLVGGIDSLGGLTSLANGLGAKELTSDITDAELDSLKEIRTVLQEIQAKNAEINVEYTKSKELLNQQTAAAKELYKLQSTFADFRAAESIDRATNNIRTGNFNYSQLGTVARAQFDYGIVDFKRDAVVGVADVSQQIKRSFSDATASIIKDGVSFGEAFKGVLTNILGSIVDKTSEIGTNFLFKGLSTAGSSLLSTFSTGGLVTNGSGTKDDVPALLTSGEYVIKRSTVNKLGKSNLDALNYGDPSSAVANLQNEFLYNDPKRPTSGSYATSNDLSIFGLTDTDISRVNATKFAKADAFYAYQKDKYDYDQQQSAALKAFYQQKKNRAYGAIFSAALGVAGAGLSTGLGSAAGSAVKSGGSYVNSVTSSSPYGNVYGNVGLRNGYAGGGMIGVNKYAAGGMVFGGQSSTDNIPAMLTAGEYVIRKDRVDKYGTNVLDKLNYGYAGGGVVSSGGGGQIISSDVLQTLNTAIDNLSKSLTQQTTQSSSATSNYVTINIDSNGSTTSNSKSNTSGDSATSNNTDSRRNKEQTLASAAQLQAAILKVINDESKQGGSIRQLVDQRVGR